MLCGSKSVRIAIGCAVFRPAPYAFWIQHLCACTPSAPPDRTSQEATSVRIIAGNGAYAVYIAASPWSGGRHTRSRSRTHCTKNYMFI
ncbi:hypothetical protein B0H12DRAFT_1113161 [Mycena haematopus]|nr:hypothetical protein B0H12DRAFT_1142887 [Mycena haematopus]KAJ7255859.1 hypothetical protein B0H12DRAFT_1113161 [Mycena haematopus]